MTEIYKKNATVTVTYRVYTTNTRNGDALECDDNGVLFSQNTDFPGFLEEYQARQALEEIQKKYPNFDANNENQEYQKYKNESWIEKGTYIVLLDDEGDEESDISIVEVLK